MRWFPSNVPFAWHPTQKCTRPGLRFMWQHCIEYTKPCSCESNCCKSSYCTYPSTVEKNESNVPRTRTPGASVPMYAAVKNPQHTFLYFQYVCLASKLKYLNMVKPSQQHTLCDDFLGPSMNNSCYIKTSIPTYPPYPQIQKYQFARKGLHEGKNLGNVGTYFFCKCHKSLENKCVHIFSIECTQICGIFVTVQCMCRLLSKIFKHVPGPILDNSKAKETDSNNRDGSFSEVPNKLRHNANWSYYWST